MIGRNRLAAIVILALLTASLPLYRYALYRAETGSSVRFYSKRFGWFPGPDYLVPAQVCAYCSVDSHGDCLGDQDVGATYFSMKSGTEPDRPDALYVLSCSCCSAHN